MFANTAVRTSQLVDLCTYIYYIPIWFVRTRRYFMFVYVRIYKCDELQL